MFDVETMTAAYAKKLQESGNAEAEKRANFKARDRLGQLSDGALREACELTDDIMCIYLSEGLDAEAGVFKDILVDLVMEEESRQ